MIEVAIVLIITSIAFLLMYAGNLIVGNNKTAMLFIFAFVVVSSLWMLVYAGDIFLQDARYEQPSAASANITSISEEWSYTYEPKYTELANAWHGMYTVVYYITQFVLMLLTLWGIKVGWDLLSGKVK